MIPKNLANDPFSIVHLKPKPITCLQFIISFSFFMKSLIISDTAPYEFFILNITFSVWNFQMFSLAKPIIHSNHGIAFVQISKLVFVILSSSWFFEASASPQAKHLYCKPLLERLLRQSVPSSVLTKPFRFIQPLTTMWLPECIAHSPNAMENSA